MEEIEGENVNVKAGPELWVSFNNVILTLEDWAMTVNVSLLSDSHVNIAQSILKHKFEKLNGLQLTTC